MKFYKPQIEKIELTEKEEVVIEILEIIEYPNILMVEIENKLFVLKANNKIKYQVENEKKEIISYLMFPIISKKDNFYVYDDTDTDETLKIFLHDIQEWKISPLEQS